MSRVLLGVKLESLDQPCKLYSIVNSLFGISPVKMLVAFISLHAPWLEVLLPLKLCISNLPDQFHWHCCGLVRQARSTCPETTKQTQKYLLSPLLALPDLSDEEAVVHLKHLLAAGVSYLEFKNSFHHF